VAPDRHLGSYIARETGADMLLWEGACVVHEDFKGLELSLLREEHPGLVLVHPESPAGVVAQADVVGSKSQLLKAVVDGDAREYIVATDNASSTACASWPRARPDRGPDGSDSATCKTVPTARGWR